MATKFRFKNAAGTTVDFEDYYVRADYFRSGNLWLHGTNTYGQLGDNTITNRSSPVQTIARGSNWKNISTGKFHTAAIKTDGTLWTWGRNSYGQLGDNSVTARSSPVQTVAFGTNWKQVYCGNNHTNAIKTDGTLWSWGLNSYGQLGDNTVSNRSSPVQTVAFGTNWMQLSITYGNSHTAAIKSDGTLWIWGLNDKGQLGDNTITNRSSPVQTVAFGNNWMQLSSSNFNTAAIKTDGTLWSWGFNYYGQLGDNTKTGRSSPVQTVAFGTNWKQVSVGYSHTASIKKDGTLWCWGDGSQGSLGDNNSTQVSPYRKSSPIQTVAYGNNWKQVSCGYKNTAAIKTDGTWWNWAYCPNGQLGDNTTIGKSSPVQTIMYNTNWKQAVTGDAAAAIQYQDDYQ